MKTKFLKRLLLGAAALGTLTVGAAQALDSVDVTVTANVIGVCRFTGFGGPYTLNIANTGTDIDPSLPGPATGSVNVNYRCSNGTSPTFTIPSPLSITDGGSGSMSATFTSSNQGAGTGMGNNRTLTINGSIVQGQYQNAPVGSYSGTLTVDVSP